MATVSLEKKNNGPISLRFNYRPELVTKIKEIKDQSWHPDAQCWTVPSTEPMIELLSAVFSK